MNRLSAVDCFRPAIQRTKALLLPMRFGFWCRLAILGLLTGELSSSGCNLNFNGFPTDTRDSNGKQSLMAVNAVWDTVLHYWWLIVLGAAVLFIFFIVLLYLSSVARFMLFEAILNGQVRLRAAWSRWRPLATSYFLFQLAFFVVLWGGLLLLIGLPTFLAYRAGFFAHFSEHILAGALCITLLAALAILIVVAGAVIHVLTKDFVVPVMALDEVSIGPAWRHVGRLMNGEKTSFLAYLGMKIVLSIGAAIASGIATVMLILLFLIPIAIVAAITIAAGAAAGLTWTPVTIALAVAIGFNAFIGLMLIITFLHTPLAAFFPSYSMYFFASRYAPLQARLYPPTPATPSTPPPPEPGPDLPPEPALG